MYNIKGMRKYFRLFFIYLTILLCGCSSNQTEREISSANQKCAGLYEDLFGERIQTLKLTELYNEFRREMSLVQINKKLMNVVETDALQENQKKNLLVMAMLKRAQPRSTEDVLIENFWKQFRRCN